MVVGEVATGVDLLVIGGGPGGYSAALRAAAAGRTVTLVERDRLGGVCLNIGCIPSKALIHVADTAALPDETGAIGVDLQASVDLDRAQAWIGDVVGRLTGGVEQLLRDAGVTLATGTARFATARRVAVTLGDDANFYEFKSVVLATGSRTVELPGLPFDDERIIDSTAALALRRVPPRLTVVGGGYIGVELGGAFAKLGAEVTIIELADQLLPGMPLGLARTLERALRARGVTIRLGTKVLEREGNDLVVEGPSGEARLPIGAAASERRPAPAADGDSGPDGVVIVAVGRRPNTDSLGLSQAGIKLDTDGRIVVAADRRAAPDVYAIGDITPGPALAHKATAEAEVAVTAAGGRRAAFDPATIPAVVFSDPQVATVGLTAEQAGQLHLAAPDQISTFRFPLSASGRALALARPEGYVEVVAERGGGPTGGTVLGVHMVGAGVAELAAEAALAIEMGATAEDLALTIAPHPTLSEALAEAAMGALGRPLHVRRRKAPGTP
ncbi:MAG TPA: dihydrolipoyl dehydrogenase [Acidimicrobiia bacterium]|jgi:dihydrolipoamide dehydrogenase|nr:dihydrolipoyl dehydrogenase [Acidimicrobiia bacterium]